MLSTPPPHISTRPTLAQLRTNKSPFLKSYSHKVDGKIHPSPLCPLSSVFCYKLLSTILENSLFCASTLCGGMVHVLIKTVISTTAISVSNVTMKVIPSLHLVLGGKTNWFPKWWIGVCNRTPTLCNIHTHDTHHFFNCTHIRTTLSPLDLWADPAEVMELLARWRDKLAGGPQAGSSDSPTNKGQGSGVDNNNNLQKR